MTTNIRSATRSDLPQLLALQNWCIENVPGLWIEKPHTLEGRTHWFDECEAQNYPIFVAETESDGIIGYASYGRYRAREGYDLTVEHSLYLYPAARGQGLGKKLLALLIETAREQGLHMMIGVIDGENQISLDLHEKLGFQLSGTVPQAGKKWGTWRDQVTMYLILDDRDAP